MSTDHLYQPPSTAREIPAINMNTAKIAENQRIRRDTARTSPVSSALASWHAGHRVVVPLMCTCHAASARR